MVIALHQHTLLDWVCHGTTVADRAMRARIVLLSLSQEDLLGENVVMNRMREWRQAYYLMHPTLIPVVKERFPVHSLQGGTFMETMETQRSA
jgi:hypothetical protein